MEKVYYIDSFPKTFQKQRELSIFCRQQFEQFFWLFLSFPQTTQKQIIREKKRSKNIVFVFYNPKVSCVAKCKIKLATSLVHCSIPSDNVTIKNKKAHVHVYDICVRVSRDCRVEEHNLRKYKMYQCFRCTRKNREISQKVSSSEIRCEVPKNFFIKEVLRG